MTDVLHHRYPIRVYLLNITWPLPNQGEPPEHHITTEVWLASLERNCSWKSTVDHNVWVFISDAMQTKPAIDIQFYSGAWAGILIESRPQGVL